MKSSPPAPHMEQKGPQRPRYNSLIFDVQSVGAANKAQTVHTDLLNRLVQLNHTVDGPNGQLRRDLHIMMALVGNDGAAIRLGGLLNVGSLTFVGNDGTAIRLGSLLNFRSLTLVGDDSTTIGLGGLLNFGSLTLVGNDGATVRLGGLLNVGSLSLNYPLDSSLEDCWVGQLDQSNRVCTYHNGHGERDGGNLANEEKTEEESGDGRRREEHGC